MCRDEYVVHQCQAGTSYAVYFNHIAVSSGAANSAVASAVQAATYLGPFY